MRNLFQLIYKFHVFLIFVLLLIASLLLLLNHNRFHRAAFLSSANEAIGRVYEKRSELSDYLRLAQVNDSLARLNTLMRNMDRSYYTPVNEEMALIDDTLHARRYRFLTAKVINNSVQRQKNFVTLNKGSRHGIKPEMGVVNEYHMVGIVKEVSENFSVVIPIINNTFKASVRLKGSGEFGLLRWTGEDSGLALVEDIPKHARVQVGDTIEATGYSKYFPEGIIAGTVETHIIKEGDNFHTIEIRLAENFSKLNYVEVVENLMKDEQNEVEARTERDDN